MIIKTTRLTLRPMTTGDLTTTFAYAGSPENTEYMLFLPYSTLEETESELRNMEEKMTRIPQRDYFFAIEYQNEHIGEISLELSETMEEAELGWILHRNHWGKGFMTEAATAIRDLAETLPTLKLLYAHCDSRNKASSTVMERIGMTLTSKSTRQNRNSGEISEEYCCTLHLKQKTTEK